MHLNIGYFVLYTPIYPITERIKTVVEFGGKVFLVDCIF